jgi:hypothetical protein
MMVSVRLSSLFARTAQRAQAMKGENKQAVEMGAVPLMWA